MDMERVSVDEETGQWRYLLDSHEEEGETVVVSSSLEQLKKDVADVIRYIRERCSVCGGFLGHRYNERTAWCPTCKQRVGIAPSLSVIQSECEFNQSRWTRSEERKHREGLKIRPVSVPEVARLSDHRVRRSSERAI